MSDRIFSVSRNLLSYSAAFLAAFPFFASAQESAEDDDEIITMSVFSVDASQDQGYRATNSISGTSLNVAIQDLPMPIEVITSEFVEDQQATDFKEALRYTSGVFTDEFDESGGTNSAGANAAYSNERSPSSRGGVGGRFSNAVSIRGYNVQFQNRMGFRVGGTVSEYGVTLGGALDSLNYERLEVVRGPSSLLYGIGVLSGIVNIIPKRPLAENQFKINAAIGSDGYQRFTAEATGPITKNLRYRVAIADEERDHWTDFQNKDLEFFVGQLEFQPWKTINILAEYQKSNTRYEGIGTQYIYDNLSDRSFGGENRNAFNEQFNWARDLNGAPNTYRISGPDTFEERDEWDSFVNVDIIPNENLTINLGGYWGGQETNRFDIEPATINNQEANLFVKRRIRLGRTEPPRYRTIIQYVPDEFITQYDNPPSTVFNDTTDFKTIRYYWMDTPQEGKFEQYRARLNYTFETPFIKGPANHSLLIGRHDIKDTIDYAQGTELFPRLFEAVNLVRNPAPSSTDSLEFRNVANLDPIRYNGELLAQPGREYQQTDIWYQGSFAVYQGRFWDDRMMLIAGLRHDRYQGLEKQYDRQEPTSGLITNPNNELNGFESEEYNFDEPISITTNTVALRYDIRDDLAIYALAAEGVSPNTGALDGNDDFIDAEQSLSKEIGIKFELLEGKISGTVSGYEIERSNAIWNFAFAPNPRAWVGGSNSVGNRARGGQDFDPSEILDGSGPIAYGVDRSYFDPADIARDPITREFPFGIVALEGQHNGTPNPQTYVYLDYSTLDAAGFRDEIEAAFRDSDRVRGFTSDEINSMFYTRTTGTFSGLNPSGVTGNTNVTFGDRARGFDMQLIYSPIENWQMIFNYAHTERKITEPFGMVAAIDQVTGTEFGTEYDSWVRALGRAAYGLEEIDNDGDGLPDQILRNGEPVSLTNIVPANSNTGGIEGANLFLGAEDEASFWNKYTIKEGPLKRLSFLFGTRYTGPAATAVTVGGANLTANLYPTPPTEARYEFDAGLTYSRKWGNTQWRFALNAYNLADNQKSYTEARYSNQSTGGTELRRTQIYHTPRSYRFSVGVTF
ncbi:TonB-dependent receptor plug domain-containing protein [Opitutaceae bacterium]|nr:TonB-dependent receptor plug domain-containing protein [Opitutaceae bacterium]